MELDHLQEDLHKRKKKMHTQSAIFDDNRITAPSASCVAKVHTESSRKDAAGRASPRRRRNIDLTATYRHISLVHFAIHNPYLCTSFVSRPTWSIAT
jgi:hypothetical protein